MARTLPQLDRTRNSRVGRSSVRWPVRVRVPAARTSRPCPCARRARATKVRYHPALLDRVDITTVNAVAHQIVQEQHGTVPVLVPDADADARKRWQHIVRHLDLPWSEHFQALEYRHVVLAQGVGSTEEYLRASRAGRGTSLQAGQREQVWRAIEEYVRRLGAEGKWTHLQLCADAAELLKTTGPRYDHVVVNEAQDLHPAQ